MKRRLLALAGAAALAGCAVGPDFHPPAPIGPDRYLAEPPASQSPRFDTALPAPPNWWTAFRSDALDDLIAQGVRNSPTLASAEASLRQSQAQLDAGAGVFYPSLGAGGSALREHGSPVPEAASLPRQTFSLFTVDASVSYVLDVFGGQRRTVEGLAAQRDEQRYEAAAAYLSLTANIANTAIAAAAYRGEVQAVQRLIGDQREELAAARAREATGADSYASVLAVQSALAANEALVPTLEQKAAAAEDLLAVLEGQPAGAWRGSDIRLDALALPDDLPLSLPSTLVRQRPDVLAAEAQMHAASAQIGVATAAMLPSFTLDGTYGVDSTASSKLFGPGSLFWSLGPSLTAPVFEGGALLNRRRAATAAFDKASADYRATALAAFGQVADTLRALEHDGAIVEAETRAVDAASEAERLGRMNEQAGLISTLAVLALDAQLEQVEVQRIEAVAQRYQDTVALYVALGGGWRDAAPFAQVRAG